MNNSGANQLLTNSNLRALRITRKTMPHKLQAMRDKTKAYRGSSIILLPAYWSMLRVAKLLHCFAHRCAQYARLAFSEHLTGSSADQSVRSFSIRRPESDRT
jgi:hypothetical protein